MERIWKVLLVGALAALLIACSNDDKDGGDEASAQIGGSMILATTTSTQDSGLLDVLVPLFQEQTGVEVKVIAVGTGAALEMAATGDADAVLVHSPTSEQKYIDQGDLVNRELIMHNDFVIVGPADDPAGVKDATDLKSAMTAIAEAGGFISRGDNSGTHTKELALWADAGIDPASVPNREESGQGMGATLNIANEKQSYTLTDRSTFLALKDNLDLEILFEDAPLLLNLYHAYVVNPDQHDGVKVPQAEAWVNFLVDPDTQKIIEDFGKEQYGQPLFFPDAGKDEAELTGS